MHSSTDPSSDASMGCPGDSPGGAESGGMLVPSRQRGRRVPHKAQRSPQATAAGGKQPSHRPRLGAADTRRARGLLRAGPGRGAGLGLRCYLLATAGPSREAALQQALSRDCRDSHPPAGCASEGAQSPRAAGTRCPLRAPHATGNLPSGSRARSAPGAPGLHHWPSRGGERARSGLFLTHCRRPCPYPEHTVCGCQ